MQPTNVIETYVCKLLLRFIVLQHVNSRRPRMHFCKMLYNRKLCPCSTLLLHLLLHLLHTQLSSALQHHHTLHYNIPVSHLQVQPLQGDAPPAAPCEVQAAPSQLLPPGAGPAAQVPVRELAAGDGACSHRHQTKCNRASKS